MAEITNFLRYPGSKRRMLGFIGSYLPDPSDGMNTYIEPFIGGGSVFFYLNPPRAIISDLNPDLIDLYLGIQTSPSDVWRMYCSFGSTKADYHRIRDNYLPSNLIERAARILYLNRTCFKGMWRHNKNGDFNVGYGGQDRRWVISEQNLLEISIMLQKANIYCCDFETTIDRSELGDFLFIDPPYRPGELEQINDHYVGKTFTSVDHQRLSESLIRATKRGAHWALTTSNHPCILSLFNGSYVMPFVRGTGRQPGVTSSNSGEVLVTSYEINQGVVI